MWDPDPGREPVEAAPEPIRFVVGGAVTEPVKVGGDAPKYPDAARAAGVKGVIVLELVITRTGAVRTVKVLRGLPLGLTEAAVMAVETWEYEPARLAGEPIDVLYIATVRIPAGTQI